MSFNAAKAVKHRLVLLAGDEPQLRRRALEELLAAAEVQRDDFDVETTAGDVSSPDEWVALASTVPFLAGRRVLIVRHVLRQAVEELRKGVFAGLPESALLILVADEESATTEDRARKFVTSRGKWEKAVDDSKGLVERFKSDSKEYKDLVRREVARAGKSMTDRSADLLLDMCGGNLSRALDEIEKLAVVVGDNDQIREADIRAVVFPSREYNIFKLIDAVTAGAMPEALRQLRILIGAQAKAEEAAISRILPMMSRTMRLIWQARLCVDAGCPAGKVPPEVRALFPEKPSFLAEKPYRQSALMSIAKRAPLPKLSACLRILSDTDARLKGALPAFNGIETLERMVLEMNVVLSAKS